MRNSSKKEFYRNIFTKCFMPECSDYIAEIHHIIPLSQYGEDSFCNFTGLCNKHHKKNKLHSKWTEKQTELLTYKFYRELEILGFSSDIPEKDFRTKIKALRNKLKIDMKQPIEDQTIHLSGDISPQNAYGDNLEDIRDIKRPLRINKAKIPEIRYINCKQCGKEVPAFTINKKYCSIKCSIKWNLENPGGNREERHCEYCDKSFFVAPYSKRKYCSVTCFNKDVLIEETKTMSISERKKVIHDYLEELIKGIEE